MSEHVNNKKLKCGCENITTSKNEFYEFKYICNKHKRSNTRYNELMVEFNLLKPLELTSELVDYIYDTYKSYALFLDLSFIPQLLLTFKDFNNLRVKYRKRDSYRYKYSMGLAGKVFFPNTREFVNKDCFIFININMHDNYISLRNTIMHELIHFKHKNLEDGEVFEGVVTHYLNKYDKEYNAINPLKTLQELFA